MNEEELREYLKEPELKPTHIFTGIFGGIAIIGISWIYSIFAYGYVGSVMWDWFMIPLFPSMPHLNLLQVAGFMMCIRFFLLLHNYTPPHPDETGKDKAMRILVPLFVPWTTLICGWILHKFL